MQAIDTATTPGLARAVGPWALVLVFTLLSGVGDAFGFIHASRVWHADRFMWAAALKSALSFQAGALMMWMALRYLIKLGVIAAETQTMLWFAVTILGVAVLSGKFLQWERIDQFLGAAVLGGIFVLMLRTGA